MKTKNNHETNDQALVIEDLSAENAEVIKGGNRSAQTYTGTITLNTSTTLGE